LCSAASRRMPSAGQRAKTRSKLRQQGPVRRVFLSCRAAMHRCSMCRLDVPCSVELWDIAVRRRAPNFSKDDAYESPRACRCTRRSCRRSSRCKRRNPGARSGGRDVLRDARDGGFRRFGALGPYGIFCGLTRGFGHGRNTACAGRMEAHLASRDATAEPVLVLGRRALTGGGLWRGGLDASAICRPVNQRAGKPAEGNPCWRPFDDAKPRDSSSR
jgi:hypothetical protein